MSWVYGKRAVAALCLLGAVAWGHTWSQAAAQGLYPGGSDPCLSLDPRANQDCLKQQRQKIEEINAVAPDAGHEGSGEWLYVYKSISIDGSQVKSHSTRFASAAECKRHRAALIQKMQYIADHSDLTPEQKRVPLYTVETMSPCRGGSAPGGSAAGGSGGGYASDPGPDPYVRAQQVEQLASDAHEFATRAMNTLTHKEPWQEDIIRDDKMIQQEAKSELQRAFAAAAVSERRGPGDVGRPGQRRADSGADPWLASPGAATGVGAGPSGRGAGDPWMDSSQQAAAAEPSEIEEKYYKTITMPGGKVLQVLDEEVIFREVEKNLGAAAAARFRSEFTEKSRAVHKQLLAELRQARAAQPQTTKRDLSSMSDRELAMMESRIIDAIRGIDATARSVQYYGVDGFIDANYALAGGVLRIVNGVADVTVAIGGQKWLNEMYGLVNDYINIVQTVHDPVGGVISSVKLGFSEDVADGMSLGANIARGDRAGVASDVLGAAGHGELGRAVSGASKVGAGRGAVADALAAKEQLRGQLAHVSRQQRQVLERLENRLAEVRETIRGRKAREASP